MSQHGREGFFARLPSRLSVAALIAANVLVAIQALLWGWGYFQVLLIYWVEALIIGGYNVLRLLVVGLFGDEPFGAWVSRWVSFSFGSRLLGTVIGAGFFIFKFGGFALLTGFWLLMLPAYFDSTGSRSAERVMEGLHQATPGVGLAVGLLVVSHGVSFVWNFLCKREFAKQSIVGLIFWPYVRMALVLVVVIGGLFFVQLNPGLDSAPAMVALFFLIKTIADVVTHLWEHRLFASREAAPRANVPRTPFPNASTRQDQ